LYEKCQADHPYVTVNVREKSRCFPGIERTTQFWVPVLQNNIRKT